MKTKQTVAWLLTLLTVASTMLSCSNHPNEKHETQPDGTSTQTQQPEDTDTSASDTTRELSELEKRQMIDDEIGEFDFNNRPFIIAVGEDFVWEFVSEGETGDPCNDAIWARNLRLENRFNTVIGTVMLDTDETIDLIKTGQTDSFTVCSQEDYLVYTLVEQGVCSNWLNIDCMNLEKPWYNQLHNEGSTIMGTLFALGSDMSLTSMTYTFAIFFNKRLAENYGMTSESLYQTVHDGEWTLDKLISCTKDIYGDLNMNNTPDLEDLYGFSYRLSDPAFMWLPSFGHSYTSVNEDGTLSFSFLTDITVGAFEKISEWHDTQGTYVGGNRDDNVQMFTNGYRVFAPLMFNDCFQGLRSMEDVYSLLPYPKYDESQEEYYISAMDEFQVFLLPKITTEESYEFVGTMMEAIAAETYKTVYPVFYDSALKGRYSKEPETAKMIDLIMKNRNFEFAEQFGESYFLRLPYLFADLLEDGTDNIASAWDMKKRMIERRVNDTFYALFTDVE